MILTSAALGVSACAPAGNLVGVPTARAVSEDEIKQRGHRIYIVTTRQPSTVPGEFFSSDRSRTMSFAAVDVVIPPNHEPGRVERPRQLPPDPDKHFVITNPRTFEGHAGYKAEVDRSFRAMPRGERNGLLWIHGYNTTLTDAVLRLAQFVEDSGYTGVPLLYTWASSGTLTGYVYDINSALIARDYLEEVPRLVSQGEIEGLDVIAHSMGNLVAMEAMRGIANRGGFRGPGKLRNVVLADADIDYDLFIAQLSRIPENKRRFYVLVSADDRALSVSRFLARRPRLGDSNPQQLEGLGLDVIDLSQVRDTSSVNHTKFVDSPQIVQLMGNRILAGDSYSEASQRTFGESIIIGANGAIHAIDELG